MRGIFTIIAWELTCVEILCIVGWRFSFHCFSVHFIAYFTGTQYIISVLSVQLVSN